MNEFQLKYGCNPNQKPARIYMADGSDLPVTILNGKPGYINFLDAFNSWQLVRELKKALGLPAAASFKHVSPAGAAIGLPLDEVRAMYLLRRRELSPWPAPTPRPRCGPHVLLRRLDRPVRCLRPATAKLIQHEVSDGIIAPGYTPRRWNSESQEEGRLQCRPDRPRLRSRPAGAQAGVRHHLRAGPQRLQDQREPADQHRHREQDLPEGKARSDHCLITLKYTQSNSVCYVQGRPDHRRGAGQQSRIHCTRLAGQKADNWQLRQHPKVLDLPFGDGYRRPPRQRHRCLHLRRVRGCLATALGRDLHRKPSRSPRGKARLAAQSRRDRGLGRLLPLRRQRRARAQVRRDRHRTAGRLHPRRQCYRDLRTSTASRWRSPACACSITKRKKRSFSNRGLLLQGGRL